MNIKVRRILYIFFAISFLIIAPPLVLYTAGFRYDFEYNRIVETGSLVIRSNPEGALIYLDGKLINKKTPTIINTILPGKINLLVKKEGYLDWENHIKIYPRTATFEEDIKLYPKTDYKSITEKTVEKYWWNNKQNKIAYKTKNELRLFNLLNKKDVLIANLDKKPLNEFKWSDHDDQFFFSRKTKNSNEYFVVDANFLDKVISINSILPDIDSMQWDPHVENTLYALSGGYLYRIPYLLKEARLIYRGEVLKFLIEKDRIIVLEKTKNNKYQALWFTPSDASTIHLLPFLSVSKFDEFITTNSYRIALLNKKTNQLIIADPSIKKTGSEKNITIINNVKKALWSDKGETLIFSDGYGIYKRIFNTHITIIPRKEKNEIIAKYSQPIKDMAWADNESRVFYSVSDSFRVIDVLSKNIRSNIINEFSLKNIFTANNANLVTFIIDGKLSALPLSLEDNRRSFLFSD